MCKIQTLLFPELCVLRPLRGASRPGTQAPQGSNLGQGVLKGPGGS